MMNLTPSVRIFLCLEPSDMRRGFDGLPALVRSVMEEDPLSGHLFVFHNRRGNLLKAVYWDRNGYAVWSKRLARGSFSFPRNPAGGKMLLPPEVFVMLTGGVAVRWRR
jgi:transposase